jgi:hypothetical protein
MTLSKWKLKRIAQSMRLCMSKEQEQAILERFGTEPEPYEWSEQDIMVQLQNYLGCGEFVKAIRPFTPQPVAVQDRVEF